MTSSQLTPALLMTAMVTVSAGTAMADGVKIFAVGGKADEPFWAVGENGVGEAGAALSSSQR